LRSLLHHVDAVEDVLETGDLEQLLGVFEFLCVLSLAHLLKLGLMLDGELVALQLMRNWHGGFDNWLLLNGNSSFNDWLLCDKNQNMSIMRFT
jgi:hypothetical protein